MGSCNCVILLVYHIVYLQHSRHAYNKFKMFHIAIHVYKRSPYVSEKLRQARGVYSDDHVARCSQLGGQFGKNLEALFYDHVGTEQNKYTKDCSHVSASDVNFFLTNYVNEELWEHIPGRQHHGFERVRHEWKIRNCDKLAKKLAYLSNRLDLWRNFVS